MRSTSESYPFSDRVSGLQPVIMRPVAWMRGVHSPSTPNGPDEWDAEFCYGDDQPTGDGWVPLYRSAPVDYVNAAITAALDAERLRAEQEGGPFEPVPPYKLAEAFDVTVEQAESATSDLGFLYRQLASSPPPPGADDTVELGCYDCGRPYAKGPDLVLSHEDWAKIAPFPPASGVLCPNCMNDRFEALGVSAGSIRARFTSGPFAEDIGKNARTARAKE